MPTITNNRSSLITDPLRNFRFLVTFKPLAGGSAALTALQSATIGFTSVSGLSVTTASIPYREGGYNTTVHQIPGQTTFAPLTLQRGVLLGSSQNMDWMKNLFATVQGGGTTRKATQNFRCDVEIAVLSHPIPSGANTAADTNIPSNTAASTDHIAMRFNVYNCWPTSVAYSDLNAGDDALLVEQMALVHEGFDVSWAGDLSTSAAPFSASSPLLA